jgi:hypothetical protein
MRLNCVKNLYCKYFFPLHTVPVLYRSKVQFKYLDPDLLSECGSGSSNLNPFVSLAVSFNYHVLLTEPGEVPGAPFRPPFPVQSR